MYHNDIQILAVFDGHGQCGHDVSDFCVKRLPSHLIEYIDQGKG